MSGRTPPLHDLHAQAGASFTDFGGWEMPVEFDSIRTEHEAVRSGVGRFDVSHMGELTISGPDAHQLLNRITTNNVAALGPGEAQYSGICTEAGHLIDDTVVYHLPSAWDETYLLVPNAGHDKEIEDWLIDHRDSWSLSTTVTNRTDEYALFAIQGPDAIDRVDAGTSVDVTDLSRFEVTTSTIADAECLVSQTGYTGEDGVEVLCDSAAAEAVWDAVDCQRCGLGARDTLRLEMGFLLSGQDFDPEEAPRTPYEAGIGFVVDLETEFIGRDVLAEQADSGVDRELTGLRLQERGVPRHGHDILDAGEVIGQVTSGTMSPTLGEPIALADLPVEYTDPDTVVDVSIRGEEKRATVESPPFLEGY